MEFAFANDLVINARNEEYLQYNLELKCFTKNKFKNKYYQK